MQVATFDRDALAAAAPTVAALSRAEDLPAHGRAVAARLAGQPGEGRERVVPGTAGRAGSGTTWPA